MQETSVPKVTFHGPPGVVSSYLVNIPASSIGFNIFDPLQNRFKDLVTVTVVFINCRLISKNSKSTSLTSCRESHIYKITIL